MTLRFDQSDAAAATLSGRIIDIELDLQGLNQIRNDTAASRDILDGMGQTIDESQQHLDRLLLQPQGGYRVGLRTGHRRISAATRSSTRASTDCHHPGYGPGPPKSVPMAKKQIEPLQDKLLEVFEKQYNWVVEKYTIDMDKIHYHVALRGLNTAVTNFMDKYAARTSDSSTYQLWLRYDDDPESTYSLPAHSMRIIY
ncbi:hypothetical protein QQS21_007661 [Conoideocrella luteorostrata]|uniref:Uncharacterized protein n=1 Tax=Conoideocrella luteorostrata TaxID=1105319 RepID=A0AAJ0CKF3_9HYPO|nr:hypothetical protein QQS21_007661 [Conoideocrella luteorostrata]